MDATALARSLLEPIPANRSAGIEVLRAADGAARVAAETAPALTNVIGSMHSSGLIALADAAGLAAVIAARLPGHLRVEHPPRRGSGWTGLADRARGSGPRTGDRGWTPLAVSAILAR